MNVETKRVDIEGTENCCSDSIIDSCSQKLKVCGHPVRLKLLCMIYRQQEPCVSELWSCLNQPQPVISQHLAVLKNKKIVESEIDGNKRIYRITDPFVRGIVETIIRTEGAE